MTAYILTVLFVLSSIAGCIFVNKSVRGQRGVHCLKCRWGFHDYNYQGDNYYGVFTCKRCGFQEHSNPYME